MACFLFALYSAVKGVGMQIRLQSELTVKQDDVRKQADQVEINTTVLNREFEQSKGKNGSEINLSSEIALNEKEVNEGTELIKLKEIEQPLDQKKNERSESTDRQVKNVNVAGELFSRLELMMKEVAEKLDLNSQKLDRNSEDIKQNFKVNQECVKRIGQLSEEIKDTNTQFDGKIIEIGENLKKSMQN